MIKSKGLIKVLQDGQYIPLPVLKGEDADTSETMHGAELTGEYVGKRQLTPDGAIYGTGNDAYRLYKYDLSGYDAVDILTKKTEIAGVRPFASFTSVSYSNASAATVKTADVIVGTPVTYPSTYVGEIHEAHEIPGTAETLLVCVSTEYAEDYPVVVGKHYGVFKQDFDNIGDALSSQSADIAELQTDKQDKLISGSGITIASNGKTISVCGDIIDGGTGNLFDANSIIVGALLSNGSIATTDNTCWTSDYIYVGGNGFSLAIQNIPSDNYIRIGFYTYNKKFVYRELATASASYSNTNVSGYEYIRISMKNGSEIGLSANNTNAITAKDLVARKIAENSGDYTKAVMTSTTDPAWSATEQANARKRIGLDKEWVLKGTISGDADDRGNIDTGVSVDLTGCTELYFVGNVTATANSHIACNFNSLAVNIVGNGTRYVAGMWTDLNDDFVGIFAKQGPSYAIANNINAYNYIGKHISDITVIKFGTISVVTSCNIKIYAR